LIALNPVDERVEYIGVRSCNGLPENDTRYQGSSKHLPRTIQYRKEIIAVWPTREEAVAHEIALHDLHDVARSPRFFNKAKQKSTGFDAGAFSAGDNHWTRKVDPEQLKGLNNPNYGKKWDKDLRSQMSIKRAGKGTGDANGMRKSEVIEKVSGANHWSKSSAKADQLDAWKYSRRGAKNSASANAANSAAAKKRMNDPDYVKKLGQSLSAAFADPQVKARMSKSMSAAAALRKSFCQAHGISSPGTGYCNIDKAAFANWLAQHKGTA
jgi:hypothetical protein